MEPGLDKIKEVRAVVPDWARDPPSFRGHSHEKDPAWEMEKDQMVRWEGSLKRQSPRNQGGHL